MDPSEDPSYVCDGCSVVFGSRDELNSHFRNHCGKTGAMAAPRETLPDAPMETLLATPRETLPAAPRETLPVALTETLPVAPRETLPAAPRETPPDTLREIPPVAPTETLPAVRREMDENDNDNNSDIVGGEEEPDHFKENKREGTIMCESCNETFSTERELNSHTLTHSESKPHVCEVCCLVITEEGKLKEHRAEHFTDSTIS